MSFKLRFNKKYLFAAPLLSVSEVGFIRFYKKGFKEYCVLFLFFVM